MGYVLLGIAIAFFLFQQREGIQTMVTSLGGNLLDKMADAIQRFEGWQVGSRSYRNNNPGNIRGSGVQWQGEVGRDAQGFVIFDTYENGRRALMILLRNAATGQSGIYSPSDSLYSFFSKYAPSQDNNEPAVYAKYVAEQIGVTVDTQISQLV
jgi:hypothetical protein